jgi:hypothetical protein
VYRNAAWVPSRSVLADPGDADVDGPLGAGLRPDVAGRPALPDVDGTTRYTGEIGGDDVVWHAATADGGWSLTAGGERRDRTEGFGFGNLFAAGEGGDATLEFHTPVLRLVPPGVQAAVWVLVAGALLRARRRHRDAAEAAAGSVAP